MCCRQTTQTHEAARPRGQGPNQYSRDPCIQLVPVVPSLGPGRQAPSLSWRHLTWRHWRLAITWWQGVTSKMSRERRVLLCGLRGVDFEMSASTAIFFLYTYSLFSSKNLSSFFFSIFFFCFFVFNNWLILDDICQQTTGRSELGQPPERDWAGHTLQRANITFLEISLCCHCRNIANRKLTIKLFIIISYFPYPPPPKKKKQNKNKTKKHQPNKKQTNKQTKQNKNKQTNKPNKQTNNPPNKTTNTHTHTHTLSLSFSLSLSLTHTRARARAHTHTYTHARARAHTHTLALAYARPDRHTNRQRDRETERLGDRGDRGGRQTVSWN